MFWLAVALAAIGAMVFGTIFGGKGILLGGLLGYVLALALNLRDKVRVLEHRLSEHERRVPPPVDVTPAVADAVRHPKPAPAAQPSQPASATAAAVPAVTAARATTPAVVVTPSLPLPPPAPSKFDLALAEAWAWLKRGNPVAKAGIVILFFGAAFLAKYAADHSLFPIEFRLAAIAAGAIALQVVGWRLRERLAVYAQVLQGGGIAGLYLTVFAAAKLYALVPPALALPLLIVVAASAALLAVAQESLALAVIGFAGGFLAPVLLSTGSGNHVALFGYYTVLNLGVFTVAWFRAWRVLNLVGFFFTFVITGVWRALSYRPEDLVTADAFVLGFFAMYVAISVLFSLRQKPELRGYVSASLVFALPVVAFSLHASLVRHIEYALAWSALGFGLFYVVLAWRLHATRHAHFTLLAEAFAALGVIFASMAVPLAFDAQATAAMWAVEGAGLVWLGIRQDRPLARAFGLLLQLGGGISYLVGAKGEAAAIPLLNSLYVGTVLPAIAAALTARWLQDARGTLSDYERGAAAAAIAWATAWWAFGGLGEIDRSLPAHARYGAALALGGATLWLLQHFSRAWAWPLPGRMAMALLPVVLLLGLLSVPGHPAGQWGWLGWPVLLAAAAFVLWAMDATDDRPAAAQPFLHAVAWAAIALVLAREGSWQVKQVVHGAWPLLPWALSPVLLLWLANRSPPRPRWPFAVNRGIYQRHASVPLVLALLLWVLVANLASDGDPVAISYVPLLNPLDLASLLSLMALAWYAFGLGAESPPPTWRPPLPTVLSVLGALAFLWLSAALVRALHHNFGAPWDLRGVLQSFMVQASLSIFWTALGLSVMIVAARRGWRSVWMVGAGLMAVVVVKLFLVDLAGTGSVARIASFISVGLLMLLAGYVSPLPPDSRKESA